MSLLDEVRAAQAPKGPPCALVAVYATLPKADAKDLRVALADPSIRGTTLAAVLKNRGFDVTEGKVRHHRNRKCTCGEL